MEGGGGMQADKRRKRENSKKNIKSKKTKAREDEGFEKENQKKGVAKRASVLATGVGKGLGEKRRKQGR
ncbi:hypothetical protein N7527_008124 [Penicillium freii]|nr:hypothetical protein N7527_008124 [Penicillium freii]